MNFLFSIKMMRSRVKLFYHGRTEDIFIIFIAIGKLLVKNISEEKKINTNRAKKIITECLNESFKEETL